MALTDSIPINLFIKLRLDILLLRPSHVKFHFCAMVVIPLSVEGFRV